MTPPTPAPVKPPRRRLRWWQVVLIAVGGIFALIGVASVVIPLVFLPMSGMTPAEQEVPVERTDLTPAVTLSGTIQPTQRLDLDFASEGEVTHVFVDVGDAVGKGDSLASIDDAELRQAVTDAKAENDAAWKDYEDARKAGSSAAATAMRSAYNLKAQALKDARAALDKATLVSTIDGVVAAVNVRPGDMAGTASAGGPGAGSGDPAASGQPSVVVISRTFQVETSVGAAERTSIAKGLGATITTSSATEPLRGSVTSVGVIAQASESAERPTAATFGVTVAIDGEPEGVFAGAAASVDIDGEGKTGALAIPVAALLGRDGQEATVLVRRGGDPEPVTITTGITAGDRIEVVSGLEEGELVVVPMGMTPDGMPGGPAGGMVGVAAVPAETEQPR